MTLPVGVTWPPLIQSLGPGGCWDDWSSQSLPVPTSEARGKGTCYQKNGDGEQTLCPVERIVPYTSQGAGSCGHPSTLELVQEGLNKGGCPTLWGHPRSWREKHKEPVGGRIEQWSPQQGRSCRPPCRDLPSFLSREVPRLRNQREKMRERNLRNAEAAGWLCREARRRAGTPCCTPGQPLISPPPPGRGWGWGGGGWGGRWEEPWLVKRRRVTSCLHH